MGGLVQRALAMSVLTAALLLPSAESVAGTVPVGLAGDRGDLRITFPSVAPGDDWYTPSTWVAAVGDVNGDGLDDPAFAIAGRPDQASTGVWVTFAPRELSGTMRAGEEGWSGLRIVTSDFLSGAFGVGDVNGDGLSDIAVMEYDAVHVVFGTTRPGTVDTGALGDAGFTIGAIVDLGGAVPVGDRNGDGRDDLVFRNYDHLVVFYPPADAGGLWFDAWSLADDMSATIALPASWGHLARLHDIDGDAHDDLLISWQDPSDDVTRLVGVASPPPGSAVDLERELEAGRGFEVVASPHVSGITIVGDQNGDGRDDIAATSGSEYASYGDPGGWSGSTHRLVAFLPPLGTHRDLAPLQPGEYAFRVGNPEIVDVGDQDGDGVDEIGGSDLVHLSAEPLNREHVQPFPYEPLGDWPGPGVSIHFSEGYVGDIRGTISDVNGDGKREFLTSPWRPDRPGPGLQWWLDVIVSTPRPEATMADEPVVLGDGGVRFAASFATMPLGQESETVAGRPLVEIKDSQGDANVHRGPIVDAGGISTDAEMDVRAGFRPGERYEYRIGLENSRALVGWTTWRSFVYPVGLAATAPVLPGGPTWSRQLPVRTIRGTNRADRLVGGSGPDVIRGLAGGDLLLALEGDDRLHGDPGPDRLDGGSGDDLLVGRGGRDRLRARGGRDRVEAADGYRDVVDCGSGKDTAVVDARDVVRRCERVRRRGRRG